MNRSFVIAIAICLALLAAVAGFLLIPWQTFAVAAVAFIAGGGFGWSVCASVNRLLRGK
jgi:hypothetical protein